MDYSLNENPGQPTNKIVQVLCAAWERGFERFSVSTSGAEMCADLPVLILSGFLG